MVVCPEVEGGRAVAAVLSQHNHDRLGEPRPSLQNLGAREASTGDKAIGVMAGLVKREANKRNSSHVCTNVNGGYTCELHIFIHVQESASNYRNMHAAPCPAVHCPQPTHGPLHHGDKDVAGQGGCTWRMGPDVSGVGGQTHASWLCESLTYQSCAGGRGQGFGRGRSQGRGDQDVGVIRQKQAWAWA